MVYPLTDRTGTEQANGVKVLTDMVADFVAHIGKKLPDDVVEKLEELGSQESAALPKVLYETMTKNQGLAVELNRPSCQDTEFFSSG